jgi:heptaprenylglyceryl phosphate synthase
MVKISILFDADKYAPTARMYLEVVKHKDLVEKVCDFWVGTTKGFYQEISFWLKKLKERGFEERFLFPGQPIHAISGRYAKYILRPELLNRTPSIKSTLAHFYTKLGKIATEILYQKNPPFELDFGYLILGPGSKVGDFTGACKISDEDALKKVENYLRRNKQAYGVYLEGGSGARIPITKRAKLLEKVREITPTDKIVFGGGGISRIEEVNLLLDLEIHPVISTYFEKNPKEIYNFAKEVYKRR